jgi:hypothetical protein
MSCAVKPSEQYGVPSNDLNKSDQYYQYEQYSVSSNDLNKSEQYEQYGVSSNDLNKSEQYEQYSVPSNELDKYEQYSVQSNDLNQYEQYSVPSNDLNEDKQQPSEQSSVSYHLGKFNDLHNIIMTLYNKCDRRDFYKEYGVKKGYMDEFGFTFNPKLVAYYIMLAYRSFDIRYVHEVMCGSGTIGLFVEYYKKVEYIDYKIKFSSSDNYGSYNTKPHKLYNSLKDFIDSPTVMDACNAIKNITEQNSAVLISWAPYNTDDGENALKAVLENPNVKYVFSLDEGISGCIANDEYFDILEEYFEKVKSYDMKERFHHINDYNLDLYKKKVVEGN